MKISVTLERNTEFTKYTGMTPSYVTIDINEFDNYYKDTIENSYNNIIYTTDEFDRCVKITGVEFTDCDFMSFKYDIDTSKTIQAIRILKHIVEAYNKLSPEVIEKICGIHTILEYHYADDIILYNDNKPTSLVLDDFCITKIDKFVTLSKAINKAFDYIHNITNENFTMTYLYYTYGITKSSELFNYINIKSYSENIFKRGYCELNGKTYYRVYNNGLMMYKLKFSVEY